MHLEKGRHAPRLDPKAYDFMAVMLSGTIAESMQFAPHTRSACFTSSGRDDT